MKVYSNGRVSKLILWHEGGILASLFSFRIRMPFNLMKTLVMSSIPPELHSRLKFYRGLLSYSNNKSMHTRER